MEDNNRTRKIENTEHKKENHRHRVTALHFAELDNGGNEKRKRARGIHNDTADPAAPSIDVIDMGTVSRGVTELALAFPIREALAMSRAMLGRIA
jgi:hypothetical protein